MKNPEQRAPHENNDDEQVSYDMLTQQFYRGEITQEEFEAKFQSAYDEVDWDEEIKRWDRSAVDAKRSAQMAVAAINGPRTSQRGGAYPSHRYNAELVNEGKYVSASRGNFTGHDGWQEAYGDGVLDGSLHQ